ncbi:murein hydrolase activator EnvC family protein [Thermodesulfobacteriota bacterium]
MAPLLRACILLLILLLCVSVPAARCQSHRKIERSKITLEDVTNKIKQQKKKIKKVEQEEAQLLERLETIDKQLARENREYTSVNRKINDIQAKIRESRKNITALKKESSLKESYLKRRLTALYKYHRRSGIKILLSAENYGVFIQQEKYLADIVGRDHQLFQHCLADLQKNRSLQKQLSSHKDDLLKAKSDLLKKRESIKSARSDKVSFLKDIKREKSLQIKALKELEEHSRELQKFVDQLPRDRKKFQPRRKIFSKMKGHLKFPVQGKIISTFGKKEHPELHTYTFQKGINIRAAEGTKIKAIYDGKVIFSDWFKGYGNIIIIDHGDNYYSLSAHASSLLKKVDDIVHEGETIALVGDTSSIKGSCLYFEIRHHGKPQNPLRWLKKGGNRS